MTDVRSDEQRLADCARIHKLWHEYAVAGVIEPLADLYAQDAVLESPLVPAILDDVPTGRLEGHAAIRRFIIEATHRRPPNVTLHRTDHYLTDGRRLTWEYPRLTPDGEQVDLVEVMEIENGLIQHHRIYWGWKGCQQIAPVLARNAERLA